MSTDVMDPEVRYDSTGIIEFEDKASRISIAHWGGKRNGVAICAYRVSIDLTDIGEVYSDKDADAYQSLLRYSARRGRDRHEAQQDGCALALSVVIPRMTPSVLLELLHERERRAFERGRECFQAELRGLIGCQR